MVEHRVVGGYDDAAQPGTWQPGRWLWRRLGRRGDFKRFIWWEEFCENTTRRRRAHQTCVVYKYLK